MKLPVVSQLVISGAALEEGGLVRAPRFLPSGQTAGDAVPVGWGSRQKTDHLPDACQLGSWKETHRQRESRGQRDVPGLAGAEGLPWEAMCEDARGPVCQEERSGRKELPSQGEAGQSTGGGE